MSSPTWRCWTVPLLALALLVVGPPVWAAEGAGPPAFSEDDKDAAGWTLEWHGYARMPLRLHGNPDDVRFPYLVDDDYYQSGFNYLRVNEKEWVELFIGAKRENTRFVAGLFASELSDWSKAAFPGQGGISTAFLEQGGQVGAWLTFRARAGMFWERFGYVQAYDTYLFGRTHIAGLSLTARLWDLWSVRAGYGAHDAFTDEHLGFTPMAWVSTGLDLPGLQVQGYLLSTWTTDSQRDFSQTEDGSLRALGADARLAVPLVGRLHGGIAHYKARSVKYMAGSFELLHSTGGKGLQENFFGSDSDDGTGEILVTAFDLTVRPVLSLGRILSPGVRAAVEGATLQLFGMSAYVLSRQQSENPLENRHDRTYFKWGGELLYRPVWPEAYGLFTGLRHDRVILDTDHESMSFRVVTPRLGIALQPGAEISLSYSRYLYGDNVSLRSKQIPGNPPPDEHTWKLQAQVAW